MNLLLNFITAIAWIWGPTALVVLAIWVTMDSLRDFDAAKRCALLYFAGLPAWAWLIARYTS